MDIVIRKEESTEYDEVENLVRESFWNVYQPGCSEHLILHQLRRLPNYLRNSLKLF